jgi:hypothetical protein
MFGRSPYGPVHEMMAKVQQCLEQMPVMLRAQTDRDWAGLAQAKAQIDRLEAQADDIKREIRRHLSTSLFSSVQRSELIALTHSMDEVADFVQEAAGLICLRNTVVPTELAAAYADLGQLVVAAGAALATVTARLAGRDSAESSEPHAFTAELDRVGRVEADCRTRQDAILRDLMAMEGRLAAMDIIFLMDIIREVGRIADQLENVTGGLVMLLGSCRS